MTGMRGWGLPEQHLALDAIVAFVDGELTAGARDRAASHLAHCPACSGEASTQRQARSAVRSAEMPSISTDLLHTLQTIPQHTELPAQPEGLALAEDGQLVTSSRVGSSTPLGSGAALGGAQRSGVATPFADEVGGSVEPSAAREEPPTERTGTTTEHHSHDARRRSRHGAGVVFSGIMLGALALINLPGDQQQDPTSQRGSVPGGADRLPATAQLPTSGARTSATHSPSTANTPNARSGNHTSRVPGPAHRDNAQPSSETSSAHSARVPVTHP